MIKITLHLKAGTRVCADDVGVCRFNRYLGGQTGIREYSCALFSELLKVDEANKYKHTLRCRACLENEDKI